MDLDCHRQEIIIHQILLSAHYVLGTVQGHRDTAIYKTIAEQEQAVHLPDMISAKTQNTNKRE